MPKNSLHKCLEIDKNHIWHPYTQAKEYKGLSPLCIVKAKGLKLYDAQGKDYYDTISSWWCNLLGHNIPRINRAIREQLSKFEHTLFAGVTHYPAIELTERLLPFLPKGIDKAFFSDNGSTAVEVALKMCYQYWQRKNPQRGKFVFLKYGYHGDTIGAMSISGVSQFNSVFKNLFFKAIMIESPAVDLQKSLEEYKKILERQGNKIAGIVLEPILQGAGGMKIYDSKFLDEIYVLSKKYGVHIIVDEIATGFGRLGKMFAINFSKLVPDFMCLSKSITNGTLPIGITMTSQKICRAFYGPYENTFFHGHTFTGNPLACVAARETLSILKEERVLEKAQANINALARRSLTLARYPFIKNLRAKGMICAFEIDSDKYRIGFKLYLEGLRNGIILRPLGNTIYLFLPLTTSPAHLSAIFKRLHLTLSSFDCQNNL